MRNLLNQISMLMVANNLFLINHIISNMMSGFLCISVADCKTTQSIVVDFTVRPLISLKLYPKSRVIFGSYLDTAVIYFSNTSK